MFPFLPFVQPFTKKRGEQRKCVSFDNKYVVTICSTPWSLSNRIEEESPEILPQSEISFNQERNLGRNKNSVRDRFSPDSFDDSLSDDKLISSSPEEDHGSVDSLDERKEVTSPNFQEEGIPACNDSKEVNSPNLTGSDGLPLTKDEKVSDSRLANGEEFSPDASLEKGHTERNPFDLMGKIEEVIDGVSSFIRRDSRAQPEQEEQGRKEKNFPNLTIEESPAEPDRLGFFDFRKNSKDEVSPALSKSACQETEKDTLHGSPIRKSSEQLEEQATVDSHENCKEKDARYTLKDIEVAEKHYLDSPEAKGIPLDLPPEEKNHTKRKNFDFIGKIENAIDEVSSFIRRDSRDQLETDESEEDTLLGSTLEKRFERLEEQSQADSLKRYVKKVSVSSALEDPTVPEKLGTSLTDKENSSDSRKVNGADIASDSSLDKSKNNSEDRITFDFMDKIENAIDEVSSFIRQESHDQEEKSSFDLPEESSEKLSPESSPLQPIEQNIHGSLQEKDSKQIEIQVQADFSDSRETNEENLSLDSYLEKNPTQSEDRNRFNLMNKIEGVIDEVSSFIRRDSRDQPEKSSFDLSEDNSDKIYLESSPLQLNKQALIEKSENDILDGENSSEEKQVQADSSISREANGHGIPDSSIDKSQTPSEDRITFDFMGKIENAIDEVSSFIRRDSRDQPEKGSFDLSKESTGKNCPESSPLQLDKQALADSWQETEKGIAHGSSQDESSEKLGEQVSVDAPENFEDKVPIVSFGSPLGGQADSEKQDFVNLHKDSREGILSEVSEDSGDKSEDNDSHSKKEPNVVDSEEESEVMSPSFLREESQAYPGKQSSVDLYHELQGKISPEFPFEDNKEEISHNSAAKDISSFTQLDHEADSSTENDEVCYPPSLLKDPIQPRDKDADDSLDRRKEVVSPDFPLDESSAGSALALSEYHSSIDLSKDNLSPESFSKETSAPKQLEDLDSIRSDTKIAGQKSPESPLSRTSLPSFSKSKKQDSMESVQSDKSVENLTQPSRLEFNPFSEKDAKWTKVLVTGANGFLASHCISQLLTAGYEVRGTVRSSDASARIKMRRGSLFHGRSDLLEIIEADLMDFDECRKAIQNCGYILHIACPLPFTVDAGKEEEVLLRPAVTTTLNLLSACSEKSSKVRKVIYTSCLTAIVCGHTLNPFGTKLTEEDWTKEHQASVSYYQKSKTLAEKTAWDFVKNIDGETRNKFAFTSLCPGFMVGPVLNVENEESFSVQVIKRLLSRQILMVPRVRLACIDVRDVAKAHVICVQDEDTSGQRIILNAGVLWLKSLSMCLANEFDEKGYYVPTKEAPYAVLWAMNTVSQNANTVLFDRSIRQVMPDIGLTVRVDTEKMFLLLDMKEPISPEESIVEMAYSMIDLGIVTKPKNFQRTESQESEAFLDEDETETEQENTKTETETETETETIIEQVNDKKSANEEIDGKSEGSETGISTV